MALNIAAAGPDCESDRKSGARLLTDVVKKVARDFRRLHDRTRTADMAQSLIGRGKDSRSAAQTSSYSTFRRSSGSPPPVRTENLNPYIMVMKSAKDGSSDRYEKLLEHGSMSAMLPWSHRGSVRTSK